MISGAILPKHVQLLLPSNSFSLGKISSTTETYRNINGICYPQCNFVWILRLFVFKFPVAQYRKFCLLNENEHGLKKGILSDFSKRSNLVSTKTGIGGVKIRYKSRIMLHIRLNFISCLFRSNFRTHLVCFRFNVDPVSSKFLNET